MGELRKFEVLLESDTLKIGGRLTGYLRTPATYQIGVKAVRSRELPMRLMWKVCLSNLEFLVR